MAIGNRNQPNKTSFISYNCRSVMRSIDCVKLLCQTADLIALQETWLMPHDIPLLGGIDRDFAYTGKSAVDTSAGILRGRPYGGVAILWRKSVFKCVSVVECKSVRLAAIKIALENRHFLVFSVYMPTEAIENLTEFTDCLSEMSAIIDSNNEDSAYMLGDFNAHPTALFGKELKLFCCEQNWMCADIDILGSSSDAYSYISDVHGSRSWLDHILVTEAANLSVIDVRIKYNISWSDHFPMELIC
ncbi:uncharacterized protein LOC142985788 [Anticarsia gemmatalis]|uniref:uncharacterized protein LOC142985788 n=1 Tax=Anticarsia gemmatalis TaxID=129554 RepID=UPI003F769D43